jgi:hypothetical protein
LGGHRQHDAAPDGYLLVIREAGGATGAVYPEHLLAEFLAEVSR